MRFSVLYHKKIKKDDDISLVEVKERKYNTWASAYLKLTERRLLGEDCVINEYKMNRHGYESWFGRM